MQRARFLRALRALRIRGSPRLQRVRDVVVAVRVLSLVEEGLGVRAASLLALLLGAYVAATPPSPPCSRREQRSVAAAAARSAGAGGPASLGSASPGVGPRRRELEGEHFLV